MLLKCPICLSQGLLNLDLKAFPDADLQPGVQLLCENENYRHVSISGVEFLAHTPSNHEEEESTSSMLREEGKMVVLN